MPRQKKQRLKRREDGRYRCKYKDQYFYGSTEEEALAARDAFKKAEESNRTREALHGLTVGEYAGKWLPIAKPTVSESTYNQCVIHLNKLVKHLGNVFLSEVKPSDVKSVYSEEYAGLSESYIRGAAQIFRALFDAAVADGYIQRNPVREKAAAPHKGTKGGHRAITLEERDQIDSLCLGHRTRAAVMLMLYAGLRPQEMKAFDIDRDVDFDAGVIRLSAFCHLDGSNHYRVTDKGKNDLAVREIPLLLPLRAALRGLHGPVIACADGRPVTIQAWRNAWDSYVFCMETAINGCEKRWYGKTREHKAMLARGEQLPPWVSFTVTPYDLRHSFATMCRDSGVEMNTVIKWMGHADEKMILRIYDEVSEARSKTEAEKLNKMLDSGSKWGSNQEEEAENEEIQWFQDYRRSAVNRRVVGSSPS